MICTHKAVGNRSSAGTLARKARLARISNPENNFSSLARNPKRWISFFAALMVSGQARASPEAMRRARCCSRKCPIRSRLASSPRTSATQMRSRWFRATIRIAAPDRAWQEASPRIAAGPPESPRARTHTATGKRKFAGCRGGSAKPKPEARFVIKSGTAKML